MNGYLLSFQLWHIEAKKTVQLFNAWSNISNFPQLPSQT